MSTNEVNVNLTNRVCAFFLFIAVMLSCRTKENSNGSDTTDSEVTGLNKQGSLEWDSNDSITKLFNDNTQQFVFITLDDGPQTPGTENCLKVFNETGIKASFFCTGYNMMHGSGEKIIDSIRNGYPQFIAVNHGFSHAMFNHYRHFYLPTSVDSALKDFFYNEQFLKISQKIIRFPGLNAWALHGMISEHSVGKLLAHRLDSFGYQVIGWDIEWRGNRRTKRPRESATEMARRVLDQLSSRKTRTPGAIVLLTHDRFFAHPAAADSLKRFIDIIRYNPSIHFETIDHYGKLHHIRSMKKTTNSGN